MEKIQYKGSAFFKFAGIIMIVFCLLSFIVHAVLFAITVRLTQTIPSATLLFVSVLLGALGAVFGIIAGFDGALYSKCPAKMQSCMLFIFAFLVFNVTASIMSFIALKRLFSFGIICILLTAAVFAVNLFCAYKCKKYDFAADASAML